jgi:hypothetical protein
MRRGRPSQDSNKKQKNRPRRTREHIIADLSVLHVQWIVANCGYVSEEPTHDYGYDLVLFTYNDAGEIENGSVYLQFKATDEIDKYIMADKETLSFPIERQHIELWREEPMPVILVVYDAKRETAYWLYTQRYFLSSDFSMAENQAEVSLHIPRKNVVDAAAIALFRECKEELMERIRKVSLHDSTSNVRPIR